MAGPSRREIATDNQEVTPVTARRATQHRRKTNPRWRTPGRYWGLGAVALTGALIVLVPGGHAHALQAAGAFKGEEISGVATFVGKLKGNLVWLGGTAMGLVIAVVGIMFMAGHSRAHDLAIRTLVGLAILASISGIIA